VKLIMENWRKYNKIMERINTLGTGKRFINDVLTEIDEQNGKIDLVPEELSLLIRWAGLSGTPSFLGSGSEGKAYLFGDKVLKITRDISEVRAAASIIGEEHPNVYKIDKVGRTPSGKFALAYEFLDYPTNIMIGTAQKMWENVNVGENKERYYNWSPDSLARARNLVRDLVEVSRESPEILSAPTGKYDLSGEKLLSIKRGMGWGDQDYDTFREFWRIDYTGNNFKNSLNTLEELQARASLILTHPKAEYYNQLASALTWLKQHGIRFTDLKTSNIMEKDGQIAIIDIGHSTVEGRPKIPLINIRN